MPTSPELRPDYSTPFYFHGGPLDQQTRVIPEGSTRETVTEFISDPLATPAGYEPGRHVTHHYVLLKMVRSTRMSIERSTRYEAIYFFCLDDSDWINPVREAGACFA